MTLPPRPLGPLDSPARWPLDPDIDFLNHGSFGSLPHAVALRQQAWRTFIEASPIERLGRRCRELLEPVHRAVAGFVGCDPDDLGFATNATEAINAVLRSLRFAPGDELLSTDHVYNAVRQTLRHVATSSGATYVEVPVKLPLGCSSDVVEVLSNAITDRTRLLVVDHITSPTAIVFPVAEISRLCAERGVDLLIDGAHAPGMLPLEIPKLGAAYYAANLHKWACAPKGSAFLWVRRDRQQGIHPATISHFLDQGFTREFDWQGTRDLSAWLTIPEAMAFMDDAGSGLGWSRVMKHNRAMARWMHAMLTERLGVEAITPLDGSMLGSMATIRLPPALQPAARGGAAGFDAFGVLQQALYDRFRIEAPIVEWGGSWFMRPCCQVYNAPEQYERLGDAIETLARMSV